MRRRLPPLNAVRAFEAAARHLSFNKAADELSVTPAAISQQVRALEEWLGVRLFWRQPRGVLLTDAGQLYWPALRDMFEIGRASWRERGYQYVSISVVAVTLKKKQMNTT